MASLPQSLPVFHILYLLCLFSPNCPLHKIKATQSYDPMYLTGIAHRRPARSRRTTEERTRTTERRKTGSSGRQKEGEETRRKGSATFSFSAPFAPSLSAMTNRALCLCLCVRAYRETLSCNSQLPYVHLFCPLHRERHCVWNVNRNKRQKWRTSQYCDIVRTRSKRRKTSEDAGQRHIQVDDGAGDGVRQEREQWEVHIRQGLFGQVVEQRMLSR